MTTTQTIAPATEQSGSSGLLAGFFAGVAAVLVAAGTGMLLAAALVALGLTETAFPKLGVWLAGAGLLGGWSQDVTADVAGGMAWSTWVAGAPMLVTLATILPVAVIARRASGGLGAITCAAGAAVAAAVLVFVGRTSVETVNAAGTVDVTEGLTWLWTGGTHPGTVTGAALLVAATWLVNTVCRQWWASGRAVAYGVLIIPGLVITVVVAGVVTWFVSSPAVGFATVLLFPFVGCLAILGAGGAPTFVGVTRLSPQPYDLWTWSGGFVYGLGGLLLVVVIAVIAGLVLRARRHEGSWTAGITVTGFLAAVIAWATDTVIAVPAVQGGETTIAVNWLAAIAVGVVLAAIALAVRGRRDDDEDAEP